MVYDLLYFGTAKPDASFREEWAAFLGRVITPRFPAASLPGRLGAMALRGWIAYSGGLARTEPVARFGFEIGKPRFARSLLSTSRSSKQEAVLRVKSYACVLVLGRRAVLDRYNGVFGSREC
jgi:hypothetical protein